jgi:Ca2+-binding EF-hand superfamily protein
LEDCKAAFSHYDKDKSGFLDKAEMNKFFNDLLNGMRITP